MGYNPFSGINLISRILILFVFLLLIDGLFFYGLRVLLKNNPKKLLTKSIFITYWAVSLLLLMLFLSYFGLKSIPCKDYHAMRIYYSLFAFFLVSYFPKTAFAPFVVIAFLSKWIFSLFNFREKNKTGRFRSQSAKRLIQSGMIFSLLVFLFMLHGILIYRFDYKVIRQEVFIENLPPAFENYSIVQFSDVHLGSISRLRPIEKLVREINELHPDILVFTGDMVNLISEEAIPFIPAFQKLDPGFLKFSVFGNHDYADYAYCMSDSFKTADKARLAGYETQMGFRVLLNEAVVLKKNGDSIALIGLENWGPPPYKKYGDMAVAEKNIKNVKVKILLSHDPKHWTMEVVPHYDIDLTLSGHTHAMQMGIKIGKFKWSPIQYKYPNWNGLYLAGKKQEYVNRGVGYIGFPGRIGLRPEITLIVLKRAK